MRCRWWLNIFVTYILYRLRGSQGSKVLQCRANNNIPTDWWYIYKPPARINMGVTENGTEFVYMWSGKLTGEWLDAETGIDSDSSMLQHTLRPMYLNESQVAAIVFTESKGFSGTSAIGVLLADDSGAGLWLGHTVPGFPEPTSDRAQIPPSEMAKGHLFACISLSRGGVNAVARALDTIAPAVTLLRLPTPLAHALPSFLLQLRLPTSGSKLIYGTTFRSQKGKVFTLMARIPGDKRCLYESFASSRKIMLDVYGNRADSVYSTVCVNNSYGVRNIKSILLTVKYESDFVNYVRIGADRARFAVSTASHWQVKGQGNESYWACVSNLDKEEKRNSPGGMLMCVEDKGIWRAFSNMKGAEPSCSQNETVGTERYG